MKKILFVDNIQFGYLTDTYKYCQYLCNDYSITYVSFDRGGKKYEIPNGKTVYVPHTKIKVFNGVRFLIRAIMQAVFFNGSIFVVYFPYCSIIRKILFWKRIHVDVRTLSVSTDAAIREKADRQLAKEVVVFDTCSFISEGILRKLKLPTKTRSFILPLGADVISYSNKDFNSLRLLYIGALYHRNILDTVKGVHLYKQRHPGSNIHYDIVGYGEEIEIINDFVKSNGLADVVVLHGRKPYEELKPFLDECNIGVSYIPIEDCFQYQPPTKTFEYAFSGLAVLATATEANKEIINEVNGVLIKDNPESFADSLDKLMNMQFDSEKIRESVKDYSWENIISYCLKPIIDN